MNRRIWTLVAAILLLVCMLAAGVTATEETTVTFAPYTDADGVRQYCACGNKFVADENGTIAYVNGENGCKNHKENGVVTSLISREEYYARHSEAYVEETFGGSLPAFLAAFGTRKQLSDSEVDELKKLIEGMRR